jgi:hypothetical protein
LPDGVDSYIGSIKTNFVCTSGGYFADVDNNCQLFHVCVPQEFPDGKTVSDFFELGPQLQTNSMNETFGLQEIAQYTFACGNQTVFNQFSLTCAHESEAIPCASSSEFFYLNERIGQEKQPIHTDEDVARYNQHIGRQ